VKKIIAAMTVGKDVSVLFPNVVKCITTQNIELKKLVYLYIMNYAKSKPDLAILAVNTFVLDTASSNPLIRALAVRTMGCIRVERISEYLCPPLHRCLKDPDPYVRKTAAVCVAKLYDINAERVVHQGFIDSLLQLLSDSNPMVVANAVAALSEIDDNSTEPIFQMNAHTLKKLLAAVNECTEWGQVFILNALANYQPRTAREAEEICERVSPRLQHANSAVVLAAAKVIMRYMDLITSREALRALFKKMGPPLVTLLSKEAEIQYVALRNIQLIVQKRPGVLAHQIEVFYCKYNDPIYVKMEKLELMIMLITGPKIDKVLQEFKEYATEADVEFVRKSVRAIGRCAVKLDEAAERCIHVLLELIRTRITYVVHESIIVIKDIFRKYPGRYESIIATLCENLEDDTIDEPEAKAAMIWIIGEYAERISNAPDLLEAFLDNFHDEPMEVQLQLLTATVKLFLKKPKNNKALVQDALNMATTESDNPDLRDRGFLYWRLLTTNPEAAKAVILARKPLIEDDSAAIDRALLDDLIANLSTLASVYHKPPETFVTKLRRLHKVKSFQQAAADQARSSSSSSSSSSSTPMPSSASSSAAHAPAAAAAAAPAVDLLSMKAPALAATSAPAPSLGGGLDDLLGLGSTSPAPAAAPVAIAATTAGPSSGPPLVNYALLPQGGQGMALRGRIARMQGQTCLQLAVKNLLAAPLSKLEVSLNVNHFHLAAPVGAMSLGQLAPGQETHVAVPLTQTGGAPPAGTPTSSVVRVALRNDAEVVYFDAQIPITAVLVEEGRVEKGAYLKLWGELPDTAERTSAVSGLQGNLSTLTQMLQSRNVFFVARTKTPDGNAVVYYSAKSVTGGVLLIELTFSAGGACQSCAKSRDSSLADLWSVQVSQTLH
jgi:AP-1 complex subunit beta-1